MVTYTLKILHRKGLKRMWINFVYNRCFAQFGTICIVLKTWKTPMEEAHIFYRFEETVYYWKLLCTKQFSIERMLLLKAIRFILYMYMIHLTAGLTFYSINVYWKALFFAISQKRISFHKNQENFSQNKREHERWKVSRCFLLLQGSSF